MCRVVVAGSDDTIPLVVISQGYGDGLGYQRVAGQIHGLSQGDVAGGDIHLVEIGQDDLQGTPLGSDNQIDSTGITA